MRDLALQIAAALALLIGIAHSYLGERYILVRLFRRELPKLFGSDWFTRRTLRFAWHLTSVSWWGFGLLLLLATGEEGVSTEAVLWVIAGTFGVSGLTSLLASRGRHLSWIVFLAIALLAAVAARGDGAGEPVRADVVSVEVSGEPGRYEFAVGIASPDTGCAQYADWWEVVGEGGELLYRRILAHSHVAEQPFVRRGGPVAIDAERVVWARAHMHGTADGSGYGGVAFTGSVAGGFVEAEPAPGFAAELAEREPLPSGCAG